MSPPLDLKLFTSSGGEHCLSPRMIWRRDGWLSAWLVSGRQAGIRRRPGLSESILGHPGRPMTMRQPLGAEPLAPVVDGERTVEEGVDIDPRARVAAAAWTGKDLEERPVERHRVVMRDGAPVFEAADAGEICGCRPPRGLGGGRGVGEAGIEARAETVKDALGLREGPCLREAEFDDEAILEGAKEPFHPTLSLGRRCGNPANSEFLERTPHLGGSHIALKLLRHALGGLRITMKDPVPIGIGGGGQAIATDELAQQQEIAVGILLGAKDSRQDFACGIVDGGEEHKAGAALLEPGMMAAVHLDKEPGLGHALAPAAMLGHAPGPGAADARLSQQALDGGAGYAEAVVLPEELGEVMIVHAGVARAGQGEDLSPYRFGEAARGGPAAVAMGEGGEAVLADLGQQATEVADREAQESGGVRGHEAPLEELGQDMCSLLLSLAQGDSPPVHAPRVTESLIC